MSSWIHLSCESPLVFQTYQHQDLRAKASGILLHLLWLLLVTSAQFSLQCSLALLWHVERERESLKLDWFFFHREPSQTKRELLSSDEGRCGSVLDWLSKRKLRWELAWNHLFWFLSSELFFNQSPFLGLVWLYQKANQKRGFRTSSAQSYLCMRDCGGGGGYGGRSTLKWAALPAYWISRTVVHQLCLEQKKSTPACQPCSSCCCCGMSICSMNGEWSD